MQSKHTIHAFAGKWKAGSAALICGLAVAACDRQKQASAPPPLPEVATVTATQQVILLTTELPGRTSPYLIAEIRPQINGLIQKRLFTEGADVKAGQELYQIDPAPYQAALDNAKAALGRAEANLPALQSKATRAKDALADKAVSQQDVDDATAAVKQAEADIQFYAALVETARINLGYTRIVSPISGRIGKSTVTDGAIVTAYQPAPLTTIQQLDPIYVDVPQSTVELLRLRRHLEAGRIHADTVDANRVQVVLEDGTRYTSDGTLQFNDVSVDPTTGSVILRMVFPNPNSVLLPGMFVRAVVKEGVNKQAILLPQQAVTRNPRGDPFAMIVDGEGKVQQRMLTLDRAMGDRWLIESGIQPGDRVIVEGLQRAKLGLAVTVVPFEPVPRAAAAPDAADKSQPAATKN
jgi:membrane fusion protein (multidrug efflux system)